MDLAKGDIIDFAGVVHDVDECKLTTTKTGQTNRRVVTLVDDTQREIEYTLWGDEALNWNVQKGTLVSLKNVRVNEYGGGKSLGTTSDTRLEINPQVGENNRLKAVMNIQENIDNITTQNVSRNTHSTVSSKSLSDFKTLKKVEDESIGKDQNISFWTKAMVSHIRDNEDNYLHYRSCPKDKCLKKVEPRSSGDEEVYYCPKCKKEYPNFLYKYLISGVISDHTGSIWVNIFDEATKLFGVSPQDFIPRYKDKSTPSNQEYCEEVFMDSKYIMYNMKINAKKPEQDGYKVRYSLDTVVPLNYAEESKKLIEEINKYLS